MSYSTRSIRSLIKRHVWIAWCFITFSGCSSHDGGNSDLPQIDQFIVDSVYLPFTEGLLTHRIREVGHGKYAPKEEVVAFLQKRDYKLYYLDLTTGDYLDSIPLDRYRNSFDDFYPIDKNAVLVALMDNSIIKIDDQSVKKWDINPITQLVGKHAFIGNLSAYALDMFGDTVMCITSTTGRKKKVGPHIPFLLANYDIVFRLLPDTVEALTKFNLNPSYFLKQDYNGGIERVYLNKDEVVYSYYHSDTLTLYNYSSGKRKKVKFQTKNFQPNTFFDYGKAMDYKYFLEYEMGNTRLGKGSLFYSNGQHRIYQLMQHKGRYLEPDGKKNDFTDLSRSLFVFDEQLNQLMEIYIPPRTFASKFYAFTTYKGLYIAAHASKQHHNDKMLFYRIVTP